MRGFLSLWRSSKRLDPAGFEALLGPHINALYRIALRLTGQVQQAEDLLQDLLSKLYSRHDILHSVEDLNPWLKRSLYNLFVERHRSFACTPFSRLYEGDAECLLDSLETDEPSPETLLAQLEDRQALLHVLGHLSAQHRAVLILHDVEGVTQSELSTLLGLPIGTVKSRLFRARMELRRLLEAREPNRGVERVSVRKAKT